MRIPRDTGGTWRKNRMVEYIGSFPDEIGPLMRDYFKQQSLSKDDQVWWILLYSSCYCMGTACVLQQELDYKTVTKSQAERFWTENKQRLIFQSDRRYIKNMNQFVDIVGEFVRRSKRHPWEYLQKFVRKTPEETYAALYKEVSSWRYYGRFGTILFMYNINKLMGIPMNSKEYDWKNGKTTTAAIFNAVYKDDRADAFEDTASLDSDDKQFLNKFLNRLVARLSSKYPEKNWTIMGVTSDLCSYRKLFKQTRYLGYYVDRQQEELIWLQERWPEYQDLWKAFWSGRKQHIDTQYLGELNGYVGIQKDKMRSWVERGEFR